MTLAVGTELVDLIGSAIDRILDEAAGKSIGIVLSGGLDSSTVAVIADTIQTGLPVFTGYYDEPGYDERVYAHQVLDVIHSDMAVEVKITPEDFVEHFDEMRAHLRSPIMGAGSFGQFMVAKFMASCGIEIAISGEGSDELFGGYARQMIVAGEAPPTGYENYVLPAGYPTDLQAALDYDYALLPDLLAVDDQMLGAWGIEGRAPFTDPAIVEYGLNLPISERIGKRHLRSAVRGLVPDSIIDRKDKIGFAIPIVKWTHEHSGVRALVLDRLGYLPDPAKPYERGWWRDLVLA